MAQEETDVEICAVNFLVNNFLAVNFHVGKIPGVDTRVTQRRRGGPRPLDSLYASVILLGVSGAVHAQLQMSIAEYAGRLPSSRKWALIDERQVTS